jgi:hypothetical protein
VKHLGRLQLTLLKIGLDWIAVQDIGEVEAIALLDAYGSLTARVKEESGSRFVSSRKKRAT